jgi:hypothetical protein
MEKQLLASYTGFHTYGKLKEYFKEWVDAMKAFKHRPHQWQITTFKVFVAILLKLRTGWSWKVVGHQLGESSDALGQLVNTLLEHTAAWITKKNVTFPSSQEELLQNVCALLNLWRHVQTYLSVPFFDHFCLLLNDTHILTLMPLTPQIPKFIQEHAPKLRLIADCTYVYLPEPQNNDLQRDIFSTHKHRHLAKVMIAVLPNGRVLCSHPPRKGKEDDAKIFQEMHQLYSIPEWYEKHKEYGFPFHHTHVSLLLLILLFILQQRANSEC